MSRAAAQLRVAQPALSRQVHDLERELGVALLDRHPRGVTPTLAGETLARGARDVLAAIGAALDKAEAIGNGTSGQVVVALPRISAAEGVADALERRLSALHRDVTIIGRDADSQDVLEDVENGDVDVALWADTPERPALARATLWKQRVDCAMIPATHPMAGRDRITIDALDALPLIFSTRFGSAGTVERAVTALKKIGLRSPLLALDVGLGGVHLSVATGRGWTIATSRGRAGAPPGTAMPTLDGLDFELQNTLHWRRKETRPLVRAVVEAIFDIARERPGHMLDGKAPAFEATSGRRGARKREPGSVPVALEFRHLRALLELAVAQSIGNAARRLGISQPALSAQIRELERAAGVTLVERSKRGATLAAAGTALASACPSILGIAERAIQNTTRVRHGLQGRCVIGAVATSAASEAIARAMTITSERHPHIHISVEDVPTPAQPAALLDGTIDIGLAHAYPVPQLDSRLEYVRLTDEKVETVILAVGHPLAQRGWVNPSDLEDYPFLFMDRAFHPAFYDRVMESLTDIELRPRIDATYAGLQTVWAIAALGKGWCLGFGTDTARPPAGTAAIPLAGYTIPWGLDLVIRRAARSAAVSAVADALRVVRPKPSRRPAGSKRTRD